MKIKNLLIIFCLISLVPNLAVARSPRSLLGKSNYFGLAYGMQFSDGWTDIDGTISYTFRNQVNYNYAWELETAMAFSTASAFSDGFKFVWPTDVKFYLGNRNIAAVVGAGMRLTVINPGDDGGDTMRQFAGEIDLGARIGFWKERRHWLIIGPSIFTPIAASDDYYESGDLRLNAAIWFNNSWGSFRFKYSAPLGSSFETHGHTVNIAVLFRF